MRAHTLRNFAKGFNQEMSLDLAEESTSPDMRNFILDEELGNLVSRKGYSQQDDSLPSDISDLKTFFKFEQSDGSIVYLIAASDSTLSRVVIFVSGLVDDLSAANPLMDPSIDENMSTNTSSGQKDVDVVDGSVFTVGDYVLIEDDNNSEYGEIALINTNTLTLAANLTNSYTTADNGHVVANLKLSEDVVPYFSVFEDWVYGFNGSDKNWRWGGDTSNLLVEWMTKDGSGIHTPTIKTNDALIPIARGATIFHNRMWVWSLSGDQSAIQCSRFIDDGGEYLYVNNEDASGNTGIEAWQTYNKRWCHKDDGEVIQGARAYNQQLLVFKNSKIFRLVGSNPQNYQFQLWTDKVGSSYFRTIAEVSGSLYFISDKGLYRITGENYEKVSDKFNTYFEGTSLAQRYLSEINISENADWNNSSKLTGNITVGGGKIVPTTLGSSFDSLFTVNGEERGGLLVGERYLKSAWFYKDYGYSALDINISGDTDWLPSDTNPIYSAGGGSYSHSEALEATRTVYLTPSDASPYSFANKGFYVTEIDTHFEVNTNVRVSVWGQYQDTSGNWHDFFHYNNMPNGYVVNRTDSINALVVAFRFKIEGTILEHHAFSPPSNPTIGVTWYNINAKGYRWKSGTTASKTSSTGSDDDYLNMLGRHIEIGDLSYDFSNVWENDASAIDFSNVVTDDSEVVGNVIQLKGSSSDTHQVLAAWDNIFEPAFWLGQPTARPGDFYYIFEGVYTGTVRFVVRGGNTASPDGTWTDFLEIEDGEKISGADVFNGTEYDYFQVGVVLMSADAEVSSMTVKGYVSVGSPLENYTGEPFAVNWEKRYLCVLPYENSSNNNAIVVNKNDAISIFDNQVFNGIVEDEFGEFFAVQAGGKKIYKYADGFSDAGTKITCYWNTPLLRIENDFLDNRLYWARIKYKLVEGSGGAATRLVNFKYRYKTSNNFSLQQVNIDSPTYGSIETHKLNIGSSGYGSDIQIGVEAQMNYERIVVSSIQVIYDTLEEY